MKKVFNRAFMAKKKVFSVFAAVLMAATVSLSAAERGKFIHVDNTVNKNLKPQIAFVQTHTNGADVTTLLVKTVNTNAYNEFTDASRILIRLSDGQAIRLNRTKTPVSKEKKYSEKKGTATISFYPTIAEYETKPELIEGLTKGEKIVKVRVVFKENEAKDYEIAEGYQAKMAADLLKSYQEAALNNKKANADLSDEDF